MPVDQRLFTIVLQHVSDNEGQGYLLVFGIYFFIIRTQFEKNIRREGKC